jgi:hypothetical protein
MERGLPRMRITEFLRRRVWLRSVTDGGVSLFCLLAVARRKSAAPQVKRGLASGVICA